jgi:hypothetical protein
MVATTFDAWAAGYDAQDTAATQLAKERAKISTKGRERLFGRVMAFAVVAAGAAALLPLAGAGLAAALTTGSTISSILTALGTAFTQLSLSNITSLALVGAGVAVATSGDHSRAWLQGFVKEKFAWSDARQNGELQELDATIAAETASKKREDEIKTKRAELAELRRSAAHSTSDISAVPESVSDNPDEVVYQSTTTDSIQENTLIGLPSALKTIGNVQFRTPNVLNADMLKIVLNSLPDPSVFTPGSDTYKAAHNKIVQLIKDADSETREKYMAVLDVDTNKISGLSDTEKNSFQALQTLVRGSYTAMLTEQLHSIANADNDNSQGTFLVQALKTLSLKDTSLGEDSTVTLSAPQAEILTDALAALSSSNHQSYNKLFSINDFHADALIVAKTMSQIEVDDIAPLANGLLVEMKNIIANQFQSQQQQQQQQA